MKKVLLGILVLALAAPVLPAQVQTEIFVELAEPAPTVVARHEAESRGEPFDEQLHRAAIQLAQDQFLEELVAAGIGFEVTSSELAAAGQTVSLPHRFTELINAVRLSVAGWDVGLIRRMESVKHISVDTGSRLLLDRSVAYIRANGPNSARSLGVRGEGALNADGSASGQVIAVLDTGIDHTNPMFDARFDDSQFEMRSGDVRPVRLQGQPYMPGDNHPKVGYRFLFAQAPIAGDDTGHGTNSATTAGGLKARADSILNNGEIVEGVAPGAVMMDYKVCPSLSCVNAQTQLALEDVIAETDLFGFPKPVATVVNMSFGSDSGDPNSANGIAAGNLQFAGVFPEASAGNSGPQENIIGSPSASRLVVSTAATTDPGVAPNSVDVLQMDASIRNTPGSPANPEGLPSTGDNFLSFFAPESNGAMGFSQPVAQHYVDIGLGDTPEQVPLEVNGRICLAERGSTVDGGAAGSGLFGNKAAQCAARGGIALIVYNNEPGQLGSVLAPSGIPVFTISREDGLFLRDTLGFESGGFGALSNFPVRINLADPGQFVPDTAGFSSRGPNNDFQVVKPDITAPGVDILMGASKIGPLGSPTNFVVASGTSFSGPHISGSAALVRDALARPGFTPSVVRAALMNTATNLREADGTPISDGDLNNFVHETGAGLADLVAAIEVRAVMGTNELNGLGGPDDPTQPNFLPSYSFGERNWLNTTRPASQQQAVITVTLADLAGGGTYELATVDAGADRGDVTLPLDTPGFGLTVSPSAVSVPAGGAATFQVQVNVDGNLVPIAGTDVTGAQASEFLWYVTARRSGDTETLRMPFYLRLLEGAADNNPPVALNDQAFTEQDTAVTIAVLDNDSDPDGNPLTIVNVTDPPNGTAMANGDGTITYTPAAGFVGEDLFNYTISDGELEDTAQVTVFVGSAGCTPTGEFFDDLEPDADPGWSFQTAQNSNPASLTWAVRPDALAQSGSNSFHSDATQTGVKDDYLISPAQVISPQTQLVFWHRFKFDVGSSGPIDGGVLEVSTDGGSSWMDVLDAGGFFLEGGYNGVMRANGNPGVIPGRAAWTGFSTFIDANNRVVVDLSALATEEVLVRWRLTLDNTIVIVDAGTGWWIDDVHFTNTGCNAPPIAVDDQETTMQDTAVTIDVLANDSDPEGDPITLDAVSEPANGSAVINPDETVTYTPDAGFFGMDSFVYQISDDQGGSDTATVFITVDPDDDDPTLNRKVTGGGWIPDGVQKANFGFNAKFKGTSPGGHLTYRAKESGIGIDGDVRQLSVGEFEASFSGNCTLDSGVECEYEVFVEDNGEPGKGADRFSIRVFMVGGVLIHEADDLLGGGNIQIHEPK